MLSSFFCLYNIYFLRCRAVLCFVFLTTTHPVFMSGQWIQPPTQLDQPGLKHFALLTELWREALNAKADGQLHQSVVIFTQCWLIGAQLENLATLSPTSSPSSGVLTSLQPLRLINHQPASVAPAGHITLRINASGGGDLVNPTAATIGHHGLAGKPRLRFVKKKTVGDKTNKSGGHS